MVINVQRKTIHREPKIISVCLSKSKIDSFYFVPPLFVVERPAAVLAAIELAFIVNRIAHQVERCLASALGADDGVAF